MERAVVKCKKLLMKFPLPGRVPPPGRSGATRLFGPTPRSFRMTLVHETKKKREEKELKKNLKKKMLYAVCACAAEL